MVKTYFILILSFLLLSSCAVQSRKEQEDYRKLFQQKQFNQANTFLDSSSLKEEKEHRLLYLVEKASLLFYQQRYKRAAQVFVEANELVDRLYTKSVREAIASSIINDNSKSFYGSLFERSLLYQYQAMSFYLLAQRGHYYKVEKKDGKDNEKKIKLTDNQVRTNLNRVRSTLIAWDSFFDEMKRIQGVKTFLKYDLLAKQVAANLHEALGTRRDEEIALQLYRDAYDIFTELGPTQKIFNKSFIDYNKQLKSFYNKSISRKQLKAKDFTERYQQTKDHLTYKILSLAKKVRSTIYQRLVNQYKPSENVKQKLKTKTANVSILIEKGMISPLKGKNYSYNLRSAIQGIESPTTRALVHGIGIPVLTYFALGPLGMGHVYHQGNTTIYTRHRAGEALTKEVGIEFELPFAAASNETNFFKLEVFSAKKKIKEIDLNYLTSLSDIAFINAQEMIANSFTKRATRVGVKYVTAILAAYTTYKQMKDAGTHELFARPAAVGQFLLSQKAIKESEKADARHWTSLPDSILSTDLYLDPNKKYQIRLVEYSGKTKTIVRKLNLGELLAPSRGKDIFSSRAF